MEKESFFGLRLPTGTTIRKKIVFSILLFLSMAIAVMRFHTYRQPLEGDITTYAVIGHEVLHGRYLYSDVWDQKPPAIYASYALAEKIAGYGPGAVYLLTVITSILTLFGIYTAGAAGGAEAGIWAALFWTVVSGDLWLQANQPNAECFMNAFLIWAFALILRLNTRKFNLFKILFISMLFMLSSFYKQITIINMVFLFAVYAGLSCKSANDLKCALRQSFTAFGITVAGWLLLTGYFSFTGRFRIFWDTIFIYNRYYAGNMTQNIIQAFNPKLLIPGFLLFTVPLLILLLLGIFPSIKKNMSRSWFLWIALAAGTFLTVASPGRFYPHYYQLWLPPLCVGSGWGMATFITKTAKSLSLRYCLGAAVVFITYQP